MFADHALALQAAHIEDEDDPQRRRRDPARALSGAARAPHAGNLVLALSHPPRRVEAFPRELGRALRGLSLAAGWPRLLLVPLARGAAWCAEDGRQNPALQTARRALVEVGVAPRFDGALALSPLGVRLWTAAWFWSVRCGALSPGVAFGVTGQNLIGELCAHGNLHLSVYGEASTHALQQHAEASGWRVLNGTCTDAFGPAIAGRHLRVR